MSKLPKSILVVEDDHRFRELVTTELSSRGFRVSECDSFTSAFGSINNRKFDLIILDMNLAESHGSDLVKWIRKNKRGVNFKTPVLVVSGLLNPQVLQAIKGKVQDALVKPIGPDELVGKVHQLLAS